MKGSANFELEDHFHGQSVEVREIYDALISATHKFGRLRRIRKDFDPSQPEKPICRGSNAVQLSFVDRQIRAGSKTHIEYRPAMAQ